MSGKKEKQYVIENAQLMTEWDWERNDSLGFNPNSITCGSTKKAWWKCSSGHLWQAIVEDRVKGSGCPYCSGRIAIPGVNDLGTVNPKLAAEWDDEKNGGLKPSMVMPGTSKKIWWRCPSGHEWQATINSRSSGTGCPYCSGRRVIQGVNDLATVNPTLATEWNHEKNGDLTPSMVSQGSDRKVWWKCIKGHEWQSAISNRAKGQGCPYCSGRKVLCGYNDLATKNPDIAAEWHPTKNNGLKPTMVSSGSNKKTWWKCKKGHEWKSTVSDRVRGNGCPYCSGKRILIGFNDLSTTNPSLAAEWAIQKNGSLKPTMVSGGSNIRVWWRCENGHEWQATVANRNQGTGCPFCSNQKVMAGYNDLVSLYPEIAAEWNYTRNGSLSPDSVTSGTERKVWWICRKGHEWEASVASRTGMKSGCPICSVELHTSFPEQAILYYCSKLTVAKNRYTDLGKEIDVYLPDYRIGIEYNGRYYHSNREEHDNKKVHYFADMGVRVITISEGEKDIVLGDVIQYRSRSSKKSSLNWAIQTLLTMVGLGYVNVDVARDSSDIYAQYLSIEKEGSIGALFPHLVLEWNYDKNKSLAPEMVTPGSNKMIWWKCKNGHEWQAPVYNRIKGVGCPYCSGVKAIPGVSDLATLKPELLKEWDFIKNKDLSPSMVSVGSEKKAWWKCKMGHEWQTSIANRAKGIGCPYCSGNKVLSGFNDLVTRYPTIAEEWNLQRNGNLLPQMVSPGSGRKVWWKCQAGHEWQASITNRVKGRRCPYCSGRSVLQGYNDLATTNPSLASEWHPTQNGNLLPTMVSRGSTRKVWWICSKGHEWQATIGSRSQGAGCPYCSGRRKT